MPEFSKNSTLSKYNWHINVGILIQQNDRRKILSKVHTCKSCNDVRGLSRASEFLLNISIEFL